MLFQIPDDMLEHFPNDNQGINLQLKIVFTAVLFLWGIISWVKSNRAELENIQKVEKTRAVFGFSYALCRIAFILATNHQEGAHYDTWITTGYFFGLAGFTAFVYGIEKYQLRQVPIFTLYGVIATFLTLTVYEGFLPGFHMVRETITPIVYVSSAVLAMVLLLLYGQLISKFSGKLRKRTSYELLGMVFFVLGVVLDGRYVVTSPHIPMFYKEVIPPLMGAMGIVLVTFAHYTSEKLLPLTIVFSIILFAIFLMRIDEFYA